MRYDPSLLSFDSSGLEGKTIPEAVDVAIRELEKPVHYCFYGSYNQGNLESDFTGFMEVDENGDIRGGIHDPGELTQEFLRRTEGRSTTEPPIYSLTHLILGMTLEEDGKNIISFAKIPGGGLLVPVHYRMEHVDGKDMIGEYNGFFTFKSWGITDGIKRRNFAYMFVQKP